jgi:hypothetical protein
MSTKKNDYVKLMYWKDKEAWEIHFYLNGKLYTDKEGYPPLLLADNGKDLYEYIEDFREKASKL